MSPTPHDPPLKVLVFAASLRADSLNRKLAAIAASIARERGAQVDLADLRDFDVPLYDGDLESAQGIPEGAARLKARLDESHAFILSSPEYNGSMPGVIKNLIDWTSRFRPQPWSAKPGLLLSASPSMAGGSRGVLALRVPLERLSARIYPDMFSLARAHQAFSDGVIADPGLQARLASTVGDFLDLAEAQAHYPALKLAREPRAGG